MEKFDYKKISIECLTPDCTNAPNDNPFFKKKVVFTGDMGTWERPTAAGLLQKLGADVNTSISRKTNIVVIGYAPGRSKLEKIIDLLSDGNIILLMNERVFCELTKPYLHLINITQ